MAIDVPALFANPRVVPAAVIPLGAALGLSYKDRPADWTAVAVEAALVAAILLVNLVRQTRGNKPHKIWRGYPWPTFVLDTILVTSAAVALTFTVRPWEDIYDGRGAVALVYGGAIAGAITCAVSGPAWVALANRSQGGPLKKSAPIGVAYGIVLTVLAAGVAGPLYGVMGSIPLVLFWTDAFLSSQAQTLVATSVLSLVGATIWAGMDLRRHLAKQRGF